MGGGFILVTTFPQALPLTLKDKIPLGSPLSLLFSLCILLVLSYLLPLVQLSLKKDQ